MVNIILVIIIGLVSGVCSFVGSNLAISRKRFRIRMDDAQDEIVLEPQKKAGKAEFIGDATQKELDEMNQPSALRKFLDKFAKPKK